jgi:hypothetical protein
MRVRRTARPSGYLNKKGYGRSFRASGIKLLRRLRSHRPELHDVRFARLDRATENYTPVVKLVTAMLWMWGRGRPWGLVWCSKEATTQCWGLTGANRVRPVPCMNSSTA